MIRLNPQQNCVFRRVELERGSNSFSGATLDRLDFSADSPSRQVAYSRSVPGVRYPFNGEVPIIIMSAINTFSTWSMYVLGHMGRPDAPNKLL